MQVYILCFWSLSRQEAWKACIQYKCFICKTICRGEKKEVLLQTPKKSQRKCIWKISFSAEVHFLLLLSLFFAGINQSIIKPFFYHRIIKNQGVTWGRDIIISSQCNCKIMTSSEEEDKQKMRDAQDKLMMVGNSFCFGQHAGFRHEGYPLMKGHTTQGDFKLISSS